MALHITKNKEKILALISVSVWGSSSDLFEIKKILKSKNIYLLEDAAEGLGSYCISNKKRNILEHLELWVVFLLI